MARIATVELLPDGLPFSTYLGTQHDASMPTHSVSRSVLCGCLLGPLVDLATWRQRQIPAGIISTISIIPYSVIKIFSTQTAPLTMGVTSSRPMMTMGEVAAWRKAANEGGSFSFYSAHGTRRK